MSNQIIQRYLCHQQDKLSPYCHMFAFGGRPISRAAGEAKFYDKLIKTAGAKQRRSSRISWKSEAPWRCEAAWKLKISTEHYQLPHRLLLSGEFRYSGSCVFMYFLSLRHWWATASYKLHRSLVWFAAWWLPFGEQLMSIFAAMTGEGVVSDVAVDSAETNTRAWSLNSPRRHCVRASESSLLWCHCVTNNSYLNLPVIHGRKSSVFGIITSRKSWLQHVI